MLVLSRKAGDSIVVGGGIRITVTQVKGNQVRIGIEAPATTRVRRGELPTSAGSAGGGVASTKQRLELASA